MAKKLLLKIAYAPTKVLAECSICKRKDHYYSACDADGLQYRVCISCHKWCNHTSVIEVPPVGTIEPIHESSTKDDSWEIPGTHVKDRQVRVCVKNHKEYPYIGQLRGDPRMIVLFTGPGGGYTITPCYWETDILEGKTYKAEHYWNEDAFIPLTIPRHVKRFNYKRKW